MAKETYYFSHDSNAITDTKILNMRADYGLEGYGLYWSIIEMLRNEETYKLELNKNTYRAIKTLTNTNIDIEKYIKDCIEDYKLFMQEKELFYSKSLLSRMLEYEKKREINRENGKLGGRPKTQIKPNGFENETEKNQNKVKESKVKENKVKKEQEEKIHFAEFVSMTNTEHEKLVSAYGQEFADQCITVLDNYKGANGKSYESDYRAILNWVIGRVKQDRTKQQTGNKEYNKYEQREYKDLDAQYRSAVKGE